MVTSLQVELAPGDSALATPTPSQTAPPPPADRTQTLPSSQPSPHHHTASMHYIKGGLEKFTIIALEICNF